MNTNNINEIIKIKFIFYMLLILNSFPKLQIFFLFFLISLISCSEKAETTIDNEKFIEIYARLLIIYEMEINKEHHDRLLDEVFREYNITSDQIDSTLVNLNENPEEWVKTLEKVRNKIQELRKELVPDEKVPEGIPRKKRSDLNEPGKKSKFEESFKEKQDRKKEEKLKARTDKRGIK